jgi:hypothetical protein
MLSLRIQRSSLIGLWVLPFMRKSTSANMKEMLDATFDSPETFTHPHSFRQKRESALSALIPLSVNDCTNYKNPFPLAITLPRL